MLRRLPIGAAPAVLEALSDWSFGGSVRYALAQPGGARGGYFVVFVFNSPQRIQGADLCAGRYAAQQPPPGSYVSVSAAFCLDDLALTSAHGTTGVAGSQTSAVAEIVSAVAAVLFPIASPLPASGAAVP